MGWRARNESLRLFGRRILMLALFLVAVVSIFGVWDAFQKERESAVLRAQAEGQLGDLSGRAEQLDSDIVKLGTDRGMEETLREQYALAAKGEHLIVLVDPPVPPPTATTTSFIEKIKHFLWPQ